MNKQIEAILLKIAQDKLRFDIHNVDLHYKKSSVCLCQLHQHLSQT